jgi:hypothetical protein
VNWQRAECEDWPLTRPPVTDDSPKRSRYIDKLCPGAFCRLEFDAMQEAPRNHRGPGRIKPSCGEQLPPSAMRLLGSRVGQAGRILAQWHG